MKYRRRPNERRMVVLVVRTSRYFRSSHIVPYPALSCGMLFISAVSAVSCRIVLYPVVSCVSCRILPLSRCILPYHAVSSRILPYPAVSCRILPHPAMSCHILPYPAVWNTRIRDTL